MRLFDVSRRSNAIHSAPIQAEEAILLSEPGDARNMLLQKNRLGCLESDGLIQDWHGKIHLVVAFHANLQNEPK